MKLMFIILVVLTCGCIDVTEGYVAKLCEISKATDEDKEKCAIAVNPYKCWDFILAAKCTKWTYYYKEFEMSDQGWATIPCNGSLTLEQRKLCKLEGWKP